MFRLERVRFAAPLTVLVALVLLSGSLVAGDADLPPGGTFADDDGNIHEGYVEAIAAIGITKGCNPPDNTKFCPGDSVTREQMAAFLRRAFDLPSSPVDAFEDDDGSIFEDDINSIAAVGITKGCNPPDNTEFCPGANVARDQMASFLGRGLGLTPINPPPFAGFKSPVAAFAAYQDVPLRIDSPVYAGPATPTSLAGIAVSPWVANQIADQSVADHLAEHGFVVIPDGYSLFHMVYDQAVYEGHPVFVTTDAAYNMWHLVFDKILRTTETDILLPELESLVLGMLTAARSQTDDLASTTLSDDALRIEEWFEAAATLLELDVGPIGVRAQQEVDLVLAHADVDESPTLGTAECKLGNPTGTCISYAMFKPRGHYTRSEELQRFFRAMSMFGQTPFPTSQPDSVRLASLLTGLLASDADLEDAWQLIYDPTAFLVGIADDYTPYELMEVVDEEVATGFADPLAFADESTVRSITDGLHAKRSITIDPEQPSVRFMGTRATLDAFILDQLIDPTVPGRVDASAMDVAAAFGSEFALEVQQAAGTDNHSTYVPQMNRMRRVVSTRTGSDWAATVYDAWLHAIAVMWSRHGAAYPDFMRTDAWAAKAHQTGLGSYAELKHDTILYVKPAFMEGEGPPEPPVPPRHWVEPDPVAYQRLAAAAELMQAGLRERGLLQTEHDDLIDELVEILGRLAGLAEDELAGMAISKTDNDWLKAFGPVLESMWLRSADLDEHGMPSELDEEAAIVADIVTTLRGALEVATGRIDPILVLVPNDQGRFQVAVGGVYSFYEFWQDPSDRLTDEEWRAMLKAGTAPDRPTWQEVLFAE